MISVHDLPAIDAVLNGTAAVLLVWGYTLILRGRIEMHRTVMISAFAVSVAFLICYLTYHAQVGSVHFQKQGTIRTVYLTFLATHTVLAAIVPFLSLRRAHKAEISFMNERRRLQRVLLVLTGQPMRRQPA